MFNKWCGLMDEDKAAPRPSGGGGRGTSVDLAQSSDSKWVGVVVDALMVIGVVIGLTFLHLSVAGPVPSGGDGGNWLALAHDRLGYDVLTPGVTYPPAFPGILSALLLLADSVPALVTAGLLARFVGVISVYVVMPRLRLASRLP